MSLIRWWHGGCRVWGSGRRRCIPTDGTRVSPRHYGLDQVSSAGRGRIYRSLWCKCDCKRDTLHSVRISNNSKLSLCPIPSRKARRCDVRNLQSAYQTRQSVREDANFVNPLIKVTIISRNWESWYSVARDVGLLYLPLHHLLSDLIYATYCKNDSKPKAQFANHIWPSFHSLYFIQAPFNFFFFFFRETNPPFPFLLGYGIAKVSQASSSLPIHGLHACTYSSLLPFFFLRPSASTSLEALIRSVGDLHHYMAKILGLGSLHLQAGSNTYRSHATSVPNLMSSTFLTSLP